MSHIIKAGSTDQILLFYAFENDANSDATIPKNDLTSASAGLTLEVKRVGATAVTIASLSDKAADNTAHSDGAIRQISENLYSVDIPDAAAASQVPSLVIAGTLTGGSIQGIPHPVGGYDVTATAVGANTTTPLDAAGTRTAVGLASANLDTQIATLATSTALATVDVNVDAILVDTGTSIPATLTSIAADADTAATEATANGVTLINAFPTNFASLLINGSGHLSRVTLVDTTTTNTDMRGTDSAYTGTPPTAAAISSQVASDLATAHGAGSWATATGFSTLDSTAVQAAAKAAMVDLLETDTDLPGTKSYKDTLILISAACVGETSTVSGTTTFKNLGGTGVFTSVLVSADRDVTLL